MRWLGHSCDLYVTLLSAVFATPRDAFLSKRPFSTLAIEREDSSSIASFVSTNVRIRCVASGIWRHERTIHRFSVQDRSTESPIEWRRQERCFEGFKNVHANSDVRICDVLPRAIKRTPVVQTANGSIELHDD